MVKKHSKKGQMQNMKTCRHTSCGFNKHKKNLPWFSCFLRHPTSKWCSLFYTPRAQHSSHHLQSLTDCIHGTVTGIKCMLLLFAGGRRTLQ